MRLHVTLVNPPYPRGDFLHPPFPPLGLGYLAAVLLKNQFEVDVIDCTTTKMTHEEAGKEISKRQPDIVGITSTILTYKSALKIAKIAKEVCPKCITILGGPLVTFWDEKALQQCASLDIVVRKEGENTMLELVQRIEAGKDYSDVLGTTCRKDGKIVKNPDRPYIQNLDDTPLPARHLWPKESFTRYGIFNLVSSRGCLEWCNFCTEVRLHGRKHRGRSPKNVVDELEFLHNKYGAEYFCFLDAAFTANQHRAAEICEEIKNRKLKIKWSCETRIDMISKELLHKMKEAGCISIWFGVESGSQTVLNGMKKGISLAQVERTFKMAKEAGIKPEPNMILGFPGETKKTTWESIRFVKKLNPDHMGCYAVATPYPGTPMYDIIEKNGWLEVTDFEKYDTATATFGTPTLSMKELTKIYDQAFKGYYYHPTYVLRMFIKGGTYSFAAVRGACADLLLAIRFKLHNKLPEYR
jgi:anaerobic magnesium-protoporphyrin IX monomethyl ester cyclase